MLMHGSAATLSGNTTSGNVTHGWGGGGVFLADAKC
jgi:hypothetical protein